jgi:hypothetical protein
VDDEILCLDSDDTSGDEFPDLTKPPSKKEKKLPEENLLKKIPHQSMHNL